MCLLSPGTRYMLPVDNEPGYVSGPTETLAESSRLLHKKPRIAGLRSHLTSFTPSGRSRECLRPCRPARQKQTGVFEKIFLSAFTASENFTVWLH